jgi:hypothetical protein
MAPSIAFTNSDRIARDQAKEDVNEIAASIVHSWQKAARVVVR